MQKRLAILMEAGKFGRFDCKACGRYFSEPARGDALTTTARQRHGECGPRSKRHEIGASLMRRGIPLSHPVSAVNVPSDCCTYPTLSTEDQHLRWHGAPNSKFTAGFLICG